MRKNCRDRLGVNVAFDWFIYCVSC